MPKSTYELTTLTMGIFSEITALLEKPYPEQKNHSTIRRIIEFLISHDAENPEAYIEKLIQYISEYGDWRPATDIILHFSTTLEMLQERARSANVFRSIADEMKFAHATFACEKFLVYRQPADHI